MNEDELRSLLKAVPAQQSQVDITQAMRTGQRTRRHRRLAVGAMAVAAALALTIPLGINKSISTHQLQLPPGTDPSAVGHALMGEQNILLVGLDKSDVPRADLILVLHLDASHQRGYIVPIPRDLKVSVPGHGVAKVNAAFSFGAQHKPSKQEARAGGLSLLIRTLHQETGLTFNAAAVFDDQAFTALIDQLNGVTMTVDERVTSVHIGTTAQGHPCAPAVFGAYANARPTAGCNGKVYEPGVHRFTSTEALDYVRQREWMHNNDGDYGRQRHAGQLVRAVLQELRMRDLPSHPVQALQMLTSLGENLSIWTNGASTMDWFETVKGLKDVVQVATNNGSFNSEQVNGTFEQLSDDSKQMLTSLQNGSIDAFLRTHPSWLVS